MDKDSFIRQGPVWKFGDNINTDLIFPNAAFRLPVEEQPKLVFHANRPGWINEVKIGDILVAGTDFGMGSGRAIGWLLMQCGIRGIVADSINGLGLRNCINYGMPAIACQGISLLFEEQDVARIDFRTGLIENLTTGKTLRGTPMPELFIDIVNAGGIVDMLVAMDLIESGPVFAPTK